MSDQSWTGERVGLRARLGAPWRNLAFQDWLVLSFQVYMFARVCGVPLGPAVRPARVATSALLIATLATLYLTRGAWMSSGFRRSATYRIGLFVPMVSSYFALRFCLPALQLRLLDARLYRIDCRLFGDTPAVWLDRFVTPATVEWFAFFYYGYFFLVAAFLIGTLVFDSGRSHYELLLSSALVVALGHAFYTLVPGVGPHVYCAAMFRHELIGGTWWDRVERTVRSGGAMLDIFPSLHTALPVLFVLHSFRHRKITPFRQIWLPLGVVVANIVVATMFLRWHYGIDVIAGGLLAISAHCAAIAVWRLERARDLDGERQPVWERLVPADMDARDFKMIAALFLIHMSAIAVAAAAT